jgi:hypothetical protein
LLFNAKITQIGSSRDGTKILAKLFTHFASDCAIETRRLGVVGRIWMVMFSFEAV